SPFHNPKTADLKPHNSLITNACFDCHSSPNSGFKLTPWIDDKQEWERRLKSTTAEEKLEAENLLGQLYRTLVDGNNMPPASESTLRQQFKKHPNHATFVSFIKEKFEQLPQNAVNTQERKAASNRVSVMEEKLENHYRSLLPKVSSQTLNNLFSDPNLIFMDETHLVAGYQDPSPKAMGERTTTPGFKGAGFAKDAPYLDSKGHLKLWTTGFGVDQSPNLKRFHFLQLPQNEMGELQKIKVSSRRSASPDDGIVYDWKFPLGTVSGEVIASVDSEGKEHVLEVRLRTKDNSEGPWGADIFRPYPTKTILMDELLKISQSNSPLASEADKVMKELKLSGRLTPQSSGMHGYQRGELNSDGGTEVLPEMSEALTKRLLQVPFQSSLGSEWDRNEKVKAFGATSDQPFSIVPQNNTEGSVQVGRESCGRCHKNSNTPIRDFFNPNHPKYYSSIVAYGNTPGSDQQLRFHPFDQELFKWFGNDTYEKKIGKADNREFNPALKPILEILPSKK
ncbi:MAG: hypothetical protein ACKOA8_05930, partial [Deltaproteobacteria bacterium]